MTKQNLAVVFPGQGSQKVGMLAEFSEYEIVSETFQQASATLGYDVWDAVQNGPQEKLNLTEVTQPIMLTASIALWRIWQDKNGAQPHLLAGHSLGEWTALVASGVVDFCDAVEIVRLRGKYMQEAVAPGVGAMAAIIGLNDERVEEICREFSTPGVVSAVNYNSPEQLVIAGNAEPVARAVAACKDAGAKKAIALPVSAPFHTSLMQPAADRLADKIISTVFAVPEIPVVHNICAQTESEPEKIKTIMIEQIYKPVRWVSCIRYLLENGVENIVECGPGKVLSGLNRRIDKNIKSFSSDSADSLVASIEATA